MESPLHTGTDLVSVLSVVFWICIRKDASETSHGSDWGILNLNSDKISSHNQMTTLSLHFESSHQPPSPTLSSGSTGQSENHDQLCSSLLRYL